MGTITKTTGHNGKTRYQEEVYIGKQPGTTTKVKMLTADTTAELEDKKRLLLASLNRGPQPKPVVLTFRDHFEQWYTAICARRSEATKRSYRDFADRHILPHIGHVCLTELDASKIQAMVDQLLTIDQKRRSKAIVHACLQVACKRGLLTSNQASYVDVPPKNPSPAKAWAGDEVRTFLQVADGNSYQPYWAIACRLPMRPSEIRGLYWRNVDLDRGILYVREAIAVAGIHDYDSAGKNRDAQREFDLDPVLLGILRRHRTAQDERRRAMGRHWHDRDLVCTNELGGVITHSNLARTFERLTRRAGLKRIRLYDLRHTTITSYYNSGVDSKTVSMLAGHASVTTTENIYHHVNRTQRKAAVAHVGSLFPDYFQAPS